MKRFSKLFIIRRVRGNSMAPRLKGGQLIFASSLPKPSVQRVVIARHEGKEIIKRIQKIEGSKFFLVGDNKNRHHNYSVERRDIHAVVVAF